MTPEVSTQTSNQRSIGYVHIVYASDRDPATHRIGRWTLTDDAGSEVGVIYVHVDPRMSATAIKRLQSRVSETVTAHVLRGGGDLISFSLREAWSGWRPDQQHQRAARRQWRAAPTTGKAHHDQTTHSMLTARAAPSAAKQSSPNLRRPPGKTLRPANTSADGRNYSQAVLTTLPSDGPMSAISATRSLCRLPTASSCSDQSKQ